MKYCIKSKPIITTTIGMKEGRKEGGGGREKEAKYKNLEIMRNNSQVIFEKEQ